MNPADFSKWLRLLPVMVGLLGATVLTVWLTRAPGQPLDLRVPGADAAPGSAQTGQANAVLSGKVVRGDGQPATNLHGAWPGFRGPLLTGTSPETVRLLRSWEAGGPRELWSVAVGEGYAGPAVLDGRVYLMDYDREKRQDALRCLSLADGREIWRFAYPVSVKRNHGMSRTVPAVTDRFAVAIGPKCHVVCVDAKTGELKWGLDMVRQFGTTVPQWYAGQCPLIQGDRVILAPGGKDALLAALDLATGEVLWKTPNPMGWKMTHSSVTPVEFAGKRQYVYCASLGVVGVSAEDGALLWHTPDWKISIATVPSPVPLENGRIFLSGGYNAGAMVLQLKTEAGQILPQIACRLDPKVFGSTQHTPVYHDGFLWGTRADDGRFTCLDPAGKVVWTTGPKTNFGLGPYLLADGQFFVMNGDGRLTLIEANSSRCVVQAQAQVLKGPDSWGPLALAGGRLLVRDLTQLICLDVAQK